MGCQTASSISDGQIFTLCSQSRSRSRGCRRCRTSCPAALQSRSLGGNHARASTSLCIMVRKAFSCCASSSPAQQRIRSAAYQAAHTLGVGMHLTATSEPPPSISFSTLNPTPSAVKLAAPFGHLNLGLRVHGLGLGVWLPPGCRSWGFVECRVASRMLSNTLHQSWAKLTKLN